MITPEVKNMCAKFCIEQKKSYLCIQISKHMVTYNTDGVPMPKLAKRKTTEWIKTVAAEYHKKVGDIAYIFCNNPKILEVNKEYLQHDYYTDIITFDYSEENTISGDIFISTDTVRENASEFGTTFDDELHRVIIHGILHLCGIDDITDRQQAEMTRCENKALAMLKP